MPRTPANTTASLFGHRRILLKPSLVDLFFAALLLAAFSRPQSWQGLLADGDTGWHIRTGEYILQSGHVPRVDPFSFSRSGQPWFAWEWLADVCLAALHRWHGLAAVAAFSAVILCLSAVALLCWLLRRGVGLWIAVGVALATFSESSIHALARPHIFSLIFITIGLWLLDEDRSRAGPRLWLLVPVSALWANLHAGFAAWIAILGLLVAISALEGRWFCFRRYSLLAVLCAGATLLNPYGWRLHEHIVRYLGSSWILDHVQEFQSPRFRSENMVVFGVMLLAGVSLASRPFARKQWFEGTLVLVWAFAALRSARHIPIYGIAAAPLIASECAGWWSRLAATRHPGSAVRVFWTLSQDLGLSRHISLWAPVLGALAVLVALPQARIVDFPESSFPVRAVAANLDWLSPPGYMPRILTSDQWADYLIFRLYPHQRVFFDGRSDFYGPAIGEDYQTLMSLAPGWRRTLDRYQFDIALLPNDWPLGDILEHTPGWRLVYRDPAGGLLVRSPESVHADPKESRRECRTYQCG
ncbi:MAG TPA: hypothetical protein VMH81_34720 [Bryobacteraceae bacterium]|nr:hypothetical protein [Bryobacteraceae bacterium]